MKLNKKTEQLIKLRAAELKKLYETPNPEVDKIISELRAEATKRPQNMRKEEEIAYLHHMVQDAYTPVPKLKKDYQWTHSKPK